MSDDFYCLTALVWFALGERMPIVVAEWSLMYGNEDNQ